MQEKLSEKFDRVLVYEEVVFKWSSKYLFIGKIKGEMTNVVGEIVTKYVRKVGEIVTKQVRKVGEIVKCVENL